MLEAKAAGAEDQLNTLPDLITDHAERLEERKGEAAAKTFANIAFGLDHPLDEHYEAWRVSPTLGVFFTLAEGEDHHPRSVPPSPPFICFRAFQDVSQDTQKALLTMMGRLFSIVTS